MDAKTDRLEDVLYMDFCLFRLSGEMASEGPHLPLCRFLLAAFVNAYAGTAEHKQVSEWRNKSSPEVLRDMYESFVTRFRDQSAKVPHIVDSQRELLVAMAVTGDSGMDGQNEVH